MICVCEYRDQQQTERCENQDLNISIHIASFNVVETRSHGT